MGVDLALREGSAGRVSRIGSLDSVRGIAALVVVVAHCIGTGRQVPSWAFHFPSNLLADGDGAVSLFFALSGCVLFLSLESSDRLAYFRYLVKRVFRIYPPFVAAIFASAVLWELVRPHVVPGASDWFNSQWQPPPDVETLLGTLAMTDVAKYVQLDSAMWSLVHEIRISVIFPFVALWVMVNWRLAVIVSTLVSAACAYVEMHARVHLMFDVISTLSYLFLFTAGAALAAHAAAVRRLVGSAPLWMQAGLWLVALRLVAVPTETAFGLLTGAGAVLIVGLAFGTPATDRVLSNQPVLTWLGRISYGLYLVHLPIIMTCVHVLHARLPLPAIFGIAIVLSLGAAEIMYRAVEQPSIALGRKLAALRAFRWTMPLRA